MAKMTRMLWDANLGSTLAFDAGVNGSWYISLSMRRPRSDGVQAQRTVYAVQAVSRPAAIAATACHRKLNILITYCPTKPKHNDHKT